VVLLKPLLPKITRHEAWVWRAACRFRLLALFLVGWFALWLMLPWVIALGVVAALFDWPNGSPSLVNALVSLGSIFALIRTLAWFIPGYIAAASITLTGRSDFAAERLSAASEMTTEKT